MRFALPLLALVAAGCGSKAVPESSGATPSPSTSSLKGDSMPPAASQVDGSKPYNRRGDK